jgi:hypothetical protein
MYGDIGENSYSENTEVVVWPLVDEMGISELPEPKNLPKSPPIRIVAVSDALFTPEHT